MTHAISGFLTLGGLAACPVAWADGDATAGAGTVALKPTIVGGNPRRPVRAIEVTRLAPGIGAAELRHVVSARADDAATRRPL